MEAYRKIFSCMANARGLFSLSLFLELFLLQEIAIVGEANSVIKCDTLIVGAGVYGHTLGRILSPKQKVIIIDSDSRKRLVSKSYRYSGVIHSGIYYKPDSLKARFCVQGKELLYQYCKNNDIEFKKTGKLIVANNEIEKQELMTLMSRGQANKVDDLEIWDSAKAQKVEPNLRCISALYSPSAGIINSQQLLSSLSKEIDATKTSSKMIFSAKIISSEIKNGQFHSSVLFNNKDKDTITSTYLINAGGFSAPSISKIIKEVPTETIPPEYYALGINFKYMTATPPFKVLVYPTPTDRGLGIHTIPRLYNHFEFGPYVHYIKSVKHTDDDYKVPSELKNEIKSLFVKEIKRYYPGLNPTNLRLSVNTIGILAKTVPEGIQQDFIIQTSRTHGVKNYVALYNFESPGLTSSMAVAAYVKELLGSFSGSGLIR